MGAQYIETAWPISEIPKDVEWVSRTINKISEIAAPPYAVTGRESFVCVYWGGGGQRAFYSLIERIASP